MQLTLKMQGGKVYPTLEQFWEYPNSNDMPVMCVCRIRIVLLPTKIRRAIERLTCLATYLGNSELWRLVNFSPTSVEARAVRSSRQFRVCCII
ncbi:hypothetical protein CDAR_499221 [Caerostris darwini]|uniref:Uncharacterized protein n=1 Tax=Caerostris darwini TaxID=1538125 RepID=A0AAV4PFD9_9ARAC|nr:hypothetical protein CDAR_499221 [Caerostris darwini]